MKLNTLTRNSKLTVFGFPAFVELETKSNKDGEPAILSSISPVAMLDKGIQEYYSPVIPRNSRFLSAEDVIAADLDVISIHVQREQEISEADEVVIASRHQGTVDILTDMFPNNIVLPQVREEDIKGKKVVGTLPPMLIQHAAAYKAVAVKDFDYAKDGDISGKELEERLVIMDTISVSAL